MLNLLLGLVHPNDAIIDLISACRILFSLLVPLLSAVFPESIDILRAILQESLVAARLILLLLLSIGTLQVGPEVVGSGGAGDDILLWILGGAQV